MTRERGSATVLLLGCAGLLAVLLVGFVRVGVTEINVRRAQTAADAAALASADQLALGAGPDVARETAVAVSTANGAQLRSYRGSETEVVVVVEVSAGGDAVRRGARAVIRACAGCPD